MQKYDNITLKFLRLHVAYTNDMTNTKDETILRNDKSVKCMYRECSDCESIGPKRFRLFLMEIRTQAM